MGRVFTSYAVLQTTVRVPLLDAIGTSASAALSTRQLRAAYAGSALRVRRSSDNTEQDIGFSSGLLDTSSLTSFVGANNGFISKWYDQSGNSRDFVQTVAGNQPQIVSSGSVLTVNGNPAIVFISSANSHLDNASALSNFIGASAHTALTGLNFNSFPAGVGSNSEHCVIFQDITGGYALLGAFSTSGNGIYAYQFHSGDNFASFSPISTATNYVFISKSDGSTLSAYLNGGSPATAVTGSIDNVTNSPRIGVDFGALEFLDASMTELITFTATLSSSDLNTLGSSSNISAGGNMSAYTGITWSTVP